MRTSGPTTAWGRSPPAPISARRPITAPGSTTTPASSRADGERTRSGNTGSAEDRTRLNRAGVEFRHHHGHRAERLVGDEHDATDGRCAGVAWMNKRRASPRALERDEVAGVVEERQIAGARLIEGGDIADHAAGVGVLSERRTAPARNFSERRGRAWRKKRILANVKFRQRRRRARQPLTRPPAGDPGWSNQKVVPPEKLKNWVWSYLPFVIGYAKSKRIGPMGEFQIKLTPTDVRIRFGSHTLAQLNCVIGGNVPEDGQ